MKQTVYRLMSRVELENFKKGQSIRSKDFDYVYFCPEVIKIHEPNKTPTLASWKTFFQDYFGNEDSGPKDDEVICCFEVSDYCLRKCEDRYLPRSLWSKAEEQNIMDFMHIVDEVYMEYYNNKIANLVAVYDKIEIY